MAAWLLLGCNPRPGALDAGAPTSPGKGNSEEKDHQQEEPPASDLLRPRSGRI